MKSLGKVAIMMGFIILCTYGGVYGLKFFGINEGYPTRVVPFISMIIGTLLFLKVVDRKRLSDIGLHKITSVLGWSIIYSIFALVPIMIGAIYDKEVMLKAPIGIDIIGMVGYYFLVGFSEEILCRGYIYNTIDIRKLKIIVPAIAFAGFHYISPEFSITLFILLLINGIIYAYFYKSIGNLWPLIIFHTIWDLGSNYTNYYSNPLLDLLWLVIIMIITNTVTEIIKKKQKVAC